MIFVDDAALIAFFKLEKNDFHFLKYSECKNYFELVIESLLTKDQSDASFSYLNRAQALSLPSALQ